MRKFNPKYIRMNIVFMLLLIAIFNMTICVILIPILLKNYNIITLFQYVYYSSVILVFMIVMSITSIHFDIKNLVDSEDFDSNESDF
jgi:hypothetical protein